jgi:hypothetical protein
MVLSNTIQSSRRSSQSTNVQGIRDGDALSYIGQRMAQPHTVITASLQGQVWDALRPKFDPDVLTKPPTPVLTTFEEREAAAEAEVELFRQKMRRR